MNELSLQFQLGDSPEKIVELVHQLQENDPNSEKLTIEEARALVMRSGMLLFPRWEPSSSFMLDQIRKQDRSVSFEGTNITGELQGSRFNIESKRMVI